MSQTNPAHITLIGCGKMGSALLEKWVNAPQLKSEFTAIEPNQITIKGDYQHITDINSASASLKSSNIIILAIKPQNMGEICQKISTDLAPQTTILSIAAGQTLNNFANYFGAQQPAIRVMPNTPAAIGKGMSVAVANTQVTSEHKSLANELLSCSGLVEWVEDESLLDAVTAVSGSGPAYIFHLIEILTKSAQNAGLPDDLASTLARQTVIGSAALAEDHPSTPASILRENVTSPGGTTAAALEVLMNGKWQAIFDEAIKAATKRSIELSK